MKRDPQRGDDASAWWARAVLAIFPRRFRRRHDQEILEFVDLSRRELRGGRRAAAAFWLRTTLDLLAAALRLRLAAPVSAPEADPQHGSGRRARAARSRKETSMASFAVDLHHARRSLARRPATSGLIAATLGIGIGLNTAVFSVVHGVLFKPLSYLEPERLVHVAAAYTNDGVERAALPGGTYRAIQQSVPALAAVAAITSIRQNLSGTAAPLQVQVGWASRNLFGLLGVRPALGPGFTTDAAPGTMVLSHGLWQRAFGGDPGVIGRSVRLDDRAYTIAGVLPAGFRLHLPSFPSDIEVFKVPDDWWQNGDVWSAEDPEFGILQVLGRLAPGATTMQAGAQLAALAARLREGSAAWSRAGLALNVRPLHESIVGAARAPLLLLSGAVGLVLLLACANVAGLLLVRSEGRRREIALRLALGGGRARIVRLFLAESLLLALGGGGLGIMLGTAGTSLLQRLPVAGLPRVEEVAVDGTVLAFAVLAALTSTVLFGLAPALRAARFDLGGEMRAGRITGERGGLSANSVLVVGQLAISLVLLVGAGLLITSLKRLEAVEPGLDPDGILTFSVSAPGTRYERPLGTDRFFRALEDRIRALPGVAAAGVVWPLPLSGRVWSSTYVGGAVREVERAYAEYKLATPAYFDTIGIRLRDGRRFGSRDPRNVIVVSRKVADRCWPGQRAIGRELRASPWGPEESFTIVGVVDDARNAGLREPPSATLYFDSRGWSWTDWEVSFVVRAPVEPAALLPAIRRELASLDAEIPLAEAGLLSAFVDRQLAPNRFALALLGVFAGAAVLLALVGLYAVIAYAVGRRMRELGIRVALGAERPRIFALVLRHGVRLAALGVALGSAAALVASRLLGSLLFGVSPLDPAVFAAAAATVALAAVLAALQPACRAVRVDPATVLRSD